MITHGWLDSAVRIISPHFNSRPDKEDISLLVIHNISLPPGQFGQNYVEDFFCGNLDCSVDPSFKEIENLRVSSHLYIKRDGTLVQFVPFNQRAWHAGVSQFRSRSNCNDFSIGIELEGTDDLEYTDEQYCQLVQVTLQLLAVYPKLKKELIVGHCDIAPERKTDPGDSFDWQRYLAGISD